MGTPSYELWLKERKSPTPEADRQQRPTDPLLMSGFWRIMGARTKPDWPVAIWTDEGQTETIFQIGRKVMRTDTHENEWHEFCAASWLKCIAVKQKDWETALERGTWDDKKPAREISTEEKLDIIPATPASEGGNQPVDENGNPIDEFWLQIKTKLEAGIEKLKELGAITTMEKANEAAEILEPLRAAGKMGEEQRKKEKKPHDDASKAVQQKWVPILEPASETIDATVRAIEAFKRAEQKRIDDEAAKKRREEEAKIREAERARLAKEAEDRAAEARAAGDDPSEDMPTPEEIEERAAEVAAERMAEVPVETTKVRVGTAHGKAVSKATVYGGEITDVDLFFQSIKEHVDTKEFLQRKADALGRAKATVPGMERVQK
jgi:hypothetical protein